MSKPGGAPNQRGRRHAVIFVIAVVTILAAAWYFAPWKTVPAISTQAGPQSPTSSSLPRGSANSRTLDDLSRSLLEQMHSTPQEHGTAATSRSVLTNQQLEDSYGVVDRLQQQISRLQAEAAAADKGGDRESASQKLELVKGELSVLNRELGSIQGDLKLARAARPDDPIVQWLTGELLMLVGGEPEEILPYFERAIRGGLQRPDALVSLARVQLEANQFRSGYQTALRALSFDRPDSRNPRIWEMFGGVAFASEHFDEVLHRIDRVYPQTKPPWAADLRRRAQALQNQWMSEQQIRRAEAAADDLPRVRLTIEHQAFEQGPDGRPLGPKATGRDEVEVELFEDQAPATVANFLSLVERGFYDGTRFHWAESASMAVGGDPNTRNADPADDGSGGPGYVIPDEFQQPHARLHFRGSLAMVETAPHTAGSQFFIEPVPHPEMNHRLTVFGRVIRGQDGVDRITRGRTNLRVGRFGKTIPGDLLVRAEVIRKRPHPYQVIKE